jgi:protein required for attachment to host cells
MRVMARRIARCCPAFPDRGQEDTMPAEIEWALVADAQHARFFEREVPFGGWRERTEAAEEIHNRPSHERGTERPGRAHESVGGARHAIEPKTDPHRAAKQAFAGHLAARLEAEAGGYHRLLLVAPPAFLGDLRAELGEGARARLRGTLDKDLTKLPPAEIAAQLDGIAPG